MTEAPWLVLVNPAAGAGEGRRERVEEALAERGIEAETVETANLGELREAVAAAVAEGRNRFAAVGGDGTMNAVVNEVLSRSWERPPVVGMLPTGTACDLLRTFGIGNTLEEAADHLAGPQVYPADVGVVFGEWGRRFFVNAATVGLLAETVRTAGRMSPRWRSARYVAALLRTLPRFGPSPAEAEMGERRFAGEALGMTVANAQFIGAGFNIAPRASLADGLLDVQVFTARRREVFRLAMKARTGSHLSDPAVRRFSVPEVRIDAEDGGWPVEADGEVLGMTPAVFRVRRGLLSLKI